MQEKGKKKYYRIRAGLFWLMISGFVLLLLGCILRMNCMKSGSEAEVWRMSVMRESNPHLRIREAVIFAGAAITV